MNQWNFGSAKNQIPNASSSTDGLMGSSDKAKLDGIIVFTGADGTNAGTSGLVPAPAATDNTKYLKGDGTWADVDALPAVTSSDNGKALVVASGVWSVGEIDALPSVTSSDNGKVLGVSSGAWAAVEASSGVPDAPTTDGTYFLQCVVSSGVPVISWVSIPNANGVSF